MQLLITGATGFVGRNLLLSALQNQSYATIWVPVRNLAKFKEQLKAEGIDPLPSKVKTVESSASNWNLSAEAAASDHVIHSAGVIFARTQKEYLDTNLVGTQRLFEVLTAPKKVIVLSSLSAWGPTPAGKDSIRETDPASPLTWYGQSKLEMERWLERKFPSFPYICLRPPMIFGERDHATLPLFKMVKKPIQFKSGWHRKEYSYIGVHDLVDAIFWALKSEIDFSTLDERAFFVTYMDTIADSDLIETSSRVSGRKAWILPVPQPLLKGASRVVDSIPSWRATIPSLSVDRAKEIWPQRWVASPELFARVFGWKKTGDLGALLSETHSWYLRAGLL